MRGQQTRLTCTTRRTSPTLTIGARMTSSNVLIVYFLVILRGRRTKKSYKLTPTWAWRADKEEAGQRQHLGRSVETRLEGRTTNL